MEFKKSEPIKVTIYGTEHNLVKPTFAMSRDMNRRMKSGGEDKSFDLMCEYLGGLGLSKEVVEGMEADHVLALCEFLAPKKS